MEQVPAKLGVESRVCNAERLRELLDGTSELVGLTQGMGTAQLIVGAAARLQTVVGLSQETAMRHALTGRHTTFLRLAGYAAVLGSALHAGPASGQDARQHARLHSGQHANVVTVIAHDFAFEMPDTIPAELTAFRLRNAGTEPHHFMFYRLEPGKRLADVLAALKVGGAQPAWMHPAGGPNAVPPGKEATGSLVLQPGSYIAFCHVKSPDRVLHFAKGMMKMVTVSAEHTVRPRRFCIR